jgi:hypothetical protein
MRPGWQAHVALRRAEAAKVRGAGQPERRRQRPAGSWMSEGGLTPRPGVAAAPDVERSAVPALTGVAAFQQAVVAPPGGQGAWVAGGWHAQTPGAGIRRAARHRVEQPDQSAWIEWQWRETGDETGGAPGSGRMSRDGTAPASRLAAETALGRLRIPRGAASGVGASARRAVPCEAVAGRTGCRLPRVGVGSPPRSAFKRRCWRRGCRSDSDATASPSPASAIVGR